MSITGFEYLNTKLQEEKAMIGETILDGNLRDFLEYKRLCGIIQGLEAAQTIIRDLALKLENEDE